MKKSLLSTILVLMAFSSMAQSLADLFEKNKQCVVTIYVNEIVSSIMTRSGGFEGIGFAATSNVSRALLTERGSRFFGIEAMILSSEMAYILNVPQDIILQVDDIVIDSEESIFKIFDYLNQVESAVGHRIKVLRAGEIIELEWVSSDFQPRGQ